MHLSAYFHDGLNKAKSGHDLCTATPLPFGRRAIPITTGSTHPCAFTVYTTWAWKISGQFVALQCQTSNLRSSKAGPKQMLSRSKHFVPFWISTSGPVHFYWRCKCLQCPLSHQILPSCANATLLDLHSTHKGPSSDFTSCSTDNRS